MGKKPAEPPKLDSGALRHSPFAKLAERPDLGTHLPKATVTAVPVRAQPPKPPPPCKVRMRLETAGRSGKAVTRISGLPFENLEAIVSRMRKGLGCGASIESTDVILQGSLIERAEQWLARAGELRAIVAEPAPMRRAPSASETPSVAGEPTQLSGTERSNVWRGQRVAVVLKCDQQSGELTEGIVSDILTSSDNHPRGIKVRLESGAVGRIQVIFDARRR